MVIFPDMKVTSETHLDNLSHNGCFRCHGKLVVDEGNGKTAEPIAASCTLCHLELHSSAVDALFGNEPATPPEVVGVPHPIEQREQCLLCHETGLGAAGKIPDNHAGRTNETCQACHAASPAAAPTAPPALTATPVATMAPTVAPAHTATMTPAPTPIPTATLAPGATPEKPAATPTPTPTSTPTPRPTETPAPTVTPTPPVSGPSAIPHPLAGRTDCLMCHQDGIAGAGKIPDNHAGRTNDTCALCHTRP